MQNLYESACLFLMPAIIFWDLSDRIVNKHTMGLFLFSKEENGMELLVLVAGQPLVKLLLILYFSVCNAFEWHFYFFKSLK